MKFVRPILIALIYILISIPFIYTAAWHVGAFIINQQINAFILQQTRAGIDISSKPTYPTGFPYEYQLSYSGIIHTPLEKIHIERIEFSGWPMSGQEINIKVPDGLYIEAVYLPSGSERIDNAELVFIVPDNFPPIIAHKYIQAWQQAGDAKLTIPYFKIQRGSMIVSGLANIWLNEDLQLDVNGQFTMRDYNNFLSEVGQSYNLSEQQIAVMFGLLSSIRDQETGDITLPFSVKNNNAYISMLLLGRTPYLKWPKIEINKIKNPLSNSFDNKNF